MAKGKSTLYSDQRLMDGDGLMTHFHNNEMYDEHFAFVIELGNIDPAEMMRPATVMESGDATVIGSDV